jgi:hypothetical protein
VEAVGIVLVIVLLVAALSVVMYLSHKARQARRNDLAALADELKMSFDPEYRRDFAQHYRHFELFRRGDARRAYNTLAGTFEIARRPFRAFLGDYTYQVTSGSGDDRSTTTYNVSYIILHTPYEGLPSLTVRPETFGDKIAGAVGFEDIDFESAQFSREFFVKSSDKRFAYDVITPRMMEFLMAKRDAGSWGWKGGPAIELLQGAVCLTDVLTKRWHPDEFKVKLAFLQEFFELWPEHVLNELDGRQAM